ncbi:MAG: lysylphosphatidylglycerol synthase transmembrane domain-containing protein [Chloroflexota bacterium]
MLRRARFWIGVAITLLFLFLFVYQIRDDFKEMGQALGDANYLFLLPAVVIYAAGIFFRAVRWRYLLKPLQVYSPLRLYPLILIGMLVNNVLPARLGVVARAYILGERAGSSKMATGGTLVIELIFDGLTLLIFAAVISFFSPLTGVLQQVVYIAAGLFLAAVVVCFVLVLSPRAARVVIASVVRLLPGRWGERVERWLLLLIEGLVVMRSPLKVLVVLAMSTLVWVCEAGMFYMVGFAFDLGVPFHAYMLGTAVANLAWALLMTQGGLGSFDLALQKTLEVFNVGAGLAASYTIVLHALILVVTIPLGFMFLWLENLSLAKVVPRGEKEALGVEGGSAGGEA